MVEIIAEIAQGFEGSPKLADLLVKGALYAEADSIKFQLIYPDELATPDYRYYGFFKSLEMNEKDWSKLADEIRRHNKMLYFDIHGDKSFDIAKRFRADGVKISSTEFYNETLIKKSLESFKKIFISIGGIPIEDINSLMKRLLKKHPEVCFLYGFQAEPTPLEKNNLRKITSIQKRYPGLKIGYMDHSSGDLEDAYYLPIMAMALGVSCIEKHLSLDRIYKIEDYISALDPENFKEFVRLIRKFEKAMGSPSLALTDAEIAYGKNAIKIVVANRDLKAGKIINTNDVALKRSGHKLSGVGIRRIDSVVGKKLLKDISINTPILEDDI